MSLKVVRSSSQLGYHVVLSDYGEERRTRNGTKYTYKPLPICRVPSGYGRSLEQSRELAEKIANLLDSSYPNEESNEMVMETSCSHSKEGEAEWKYRVREEGKPIINRTVAYGNSPNNDTSFDNAVSVNDGINNPESPMKEQEVAIPDSNTGVGS